jgi:hypothetical protein
MVEERRSEPRITPGICARLIGSDEIVRVVSLSNSGCGLSPSPDGLAIDQRVEIILSLSHRTGGLCIAGVVRSRNDNVVGISFSDMPLSKKIALASFIIRNSIRS